jgi:hypothetical protein
MRNYKGENIGIGDRVRFSRAFLQSTGQYTGWAPFARGIVREMNTLSPGCTICAVQWDGGSAYAQVNRANLWREDRTHLEPV